MNPRGTDNLNILSKAIVVLLDCIGAAIPKVKKETDLIFSCAQLTLDMRCYVDTRYEAYETFVVQMKVEESQVFNQHLAYWMNKHFPEWLHG